MARDDFASEIERVDALAWERGCSIDPGRNDFIGPFVANFIEREHPLGILDLGTGTAYLPRLIDQGLSYRPHWIAVDQSKHRLQVARDLQSPSMNLRLVNQDISELTLVGEQFELILLTFTLLEISDLDNVAKRTDDLIKEFGVIIIAMPDVWHDIIEVYEREPRTRNTLKDDGIRLPKIDKFTGKAYPFHARRTEHILGPFLRQGFILEAIEQGGPEQGLFLLILRKWSGVMPATIRHA